MQNGRRWKNAITAVTLLITGLAAVPETAEARDRNRHRGRGSYGYSQGYPGYRGNGAGRPNYDPYYRNNSAYRNDTYAYRDDPYYAYRYSQPRSAGKSAAIIGGSAAAGAAVGGMTAGKKGAIIGGVLGGVGGLIYDRKTRNDNRGYGW